MFKILNGYENIDSNIEAGKDYEFVVSLEGREGEGRGGEGRGEGRGGEGRGGEGRGGEGREGSGAEGRGGGEGRGGEGSGAEGRGRGVPSVILAIFFFNISVARYYMTSLNDCGNVNGEKTLCWR